MIDHLEVVIEQFISYCSTHRLHTLVAVQMIVIIALLVFATHLGYENYSLKVQLQSASTRATNLHYVLDLAIHELPLEKVRETMRIIGL